MVTFGAGKADKEKERRKVMSKYYKELQEKIDSENNATGKEKIEYEIARIENCIKSCNYDLNNGMKDNNFIKNKLKYAEEQLLLKKEEIKKYV